MSMRAINQRPIPLHTLAFSGVLATMFYMAHVVAGRMMWADYNPLAQPISDLTAKTAISHTISSTILYGYDFFNLLFCAVLLVFFSQRYPINKLFYSGLVLKATAELLSTFGYKFFPLADTTWIHSFQNTMHYAITGIIVLSYIVLSVLLAVGLAKTKKHVKMTRFLQVFSGVFITSGILTVLATQKLPAYVGLMERINLYSLMTLKVVLAFWIYRLVTTNAGGLWKRLAKYP